MTDKAAYSINFGTAPLFIFPYNTITTWEIKTGVRVLGERDIIIESIGYMEKHLTEPLSLEGIAMQAGYSACHFARMFKAQMGADEDTVCAGLLYDAEPDKELAAEIRQTVSKDTCQILEEVRQFKQYCSEDDRAVLVVLADRLHNMRTLEFMDRQMWREKAEETLKIFSPIAAEFQKLPLKAELDELALRYL